MTKKVLKTSFQNSLLGTYFKNKVVAATDFFFISEM